MGTVGASQDSLGQVVSVSGTTAALSAETRGLTAQQGQKVQAEIEEAATAFKSEFNSIGETMLAQIHATNNDVQALAASGMSADQARAAAGDFTTRLGQLQTGTEGAVDEFKASVSNRAAAINDVIGPRLGAILTGFETDVTAFGTAVTGYSNGLAEADATSIRYQ